VSNNNYLQFPVSANDIRQAAKRLESVVVRTPMLESPYLNEIAGRRVLVKSGNHAQGIAHAATLHGVSATVVMPKDSPVMKLANTRALGATVVTYDRLGGESREDVGQELAKKNGLTLIRPYDDPMVIAGQGTCGLEIAQQAKAMGVSHADVLTCCGGGGLSAGVAIALHEDAPNLRVRPVEPENADDTCRSLIAGKRFVTPTPGELTFPVLQQLAGIGLSVSDEQVLNAMRLALLRLKLVVEPGGAVALAAALKSENTHGDAVICIVTGGNVDEHLLAQAMK